MSSNNVSKFQILQKCQRQHYTLGTTLRRHRLSSFGARNRGGFHQKQGSLQPLPFRILLSKPQVSLLAATECGASTSTMTASKLVVSVIASSSAARSDGAASIMPTKWVHYVALLSNGSVSTFMVFAFSSNFSLPALNAP